ncbi:phage tail protein [Pandoraea pnomenusa]|uniref:Phage tail protein E n=1 Tax=Pandoraea pnomenusa TaxID=93220 RepID=A0A378YM70_9BURK|nr:phage tail assembly protein [Pandoraea pnomenusa]ALR35757.1 phage tail protein [Pandoraea pnomenusa]SUA78256.1 Phage tail protein E [Pandoraea pnomenusa]
MRETITLETPIKIGKSEVSTFQLRKPGAGELRGVNLFELAQMNVDALIKVLPRITAPSLTEYEVAEMDPADLMQCGLVVAGFLLQKAAKPEASPSTSKTPSPTLQ